MADGQVSDSSIETSDDKPLTRDEQLVLADSLRRLKWGPKRPIVHELFCVLTEEFTHTGIELAVVRRHPVWTENFAVLMLLRPPSCDYWPGQYHITGSIRRGREDDDSILARLRSQELDDAGLSQPVYLRDNNFVTERGAERTQLQIARLTGEYKGKGDWFLLDQLPKNTIHHHRILISQVKERLQDATSLGW